MLDELCSELAHLLAAAKTENELKTLITGLLAPQEIEETILRWKLLVRLIEGQRQRDISEELGVSLGKIARGSRLIKYGPPEFRELIKRLNEQLPGGSPL